MEPPRHRGDFGTDLSAYNVLLMGKNTKCCGEALPYGLGVLIFECGFEGAHNSTFNNNQLFFNSIQLLLSTHTVLADLLHCVCTVEGLVV